MNSDYQMLRTLQEDSRYKLLEALWFHQISRIEGDRDKAARRGNESSWRYWAGREEGFKLAMTAIARALVQMEAEDQGGAEDNNQYEKLLDELKTKGDSK